MKNLLHSLLKSPPRMAAAALAVFAAGLACGAAFGLRWHVYSSHRNQELRLGGYRFINPLLECEVAENPVEFTELTPFRDKVASLIEDRTRDKAYTHVSVYFRDMNNGPWFGINENEPFAPASLLKVATMIAFLKNAEQRPALLSEKIVYPGGRDLNEGSVFRPEIQLAPGKAYRLDELLFRSIVHSDNNANTLVFENTDRRTIEMTYRDLGLPLPLQGAPEDFMTVRQYASFFRILFNASYLSRPMSEKALDYLSQSAFRHGIVSGVPEQVAVAHKFGERISAVQPGMRELHDCGIVYYPGNPYLLCVMSRGRNFEVLDDIIRDISAITYREVEKQREGKN